MNIKSLLFQIAFFRSLFGLATGEIPQKYVNGKEQARTAISRQQNATQELSLLKEAKNCVHWTENKGQIQGTDNAIAEQITFSLDRGNKHILLLRNGGVVYQIQKITIPKGFEPVKNEASEHPEKRKLLRKLQQQIKVESSQMEMKLVNANPNAKIITEGKSADHITFGTRGVADVHHFKCVVYQEIYPGIDWRISSTASGMKQEFLVHPGADPSKIQLKYSGQEKLYLDSAGNLIQSNKFGTFQEDHPISFQGSTEVETHFQLHKNVVTFKLDTYDPSKALLIDPFTPLWSTYYGSGDIEYAYSTASDASGNVYMTGYISAFTYGASNFVSSGAYQTSHGGFFDMFLVKFNASGTRLWATYFGGSNYDEGHGMTVDAAGNIFVTGTTRSTSGIATSGTYRTAYSGTGGLMDDFFLVKFNSSGSRVWGTYFGGGVDYTPTSYCEVDATGAIYVSGYTGSANNIATAGAHLSTFPSGSPNSGFLMKFNANGTRSWGTYYGQSSVSSVVLDLAVDGSNNVYIVGSTAATSNIATAGSYQATRGGGTDAFLVKFNASGVRQWGTYFGGTATESAIGCVFDGAGNIIICGQTASSSGIASAGASKTTISGSTDAYIAKFSTAGALVWSTYFGGSLTENAFACDVDASGNIMVAGTTNSTSGIATTDASQKTLGGGTDCFVAAFTASGVLKSATYFGGPSNEILQRGNSISADQSGGMYLAGSTLSSSGIASTGAHDVTYAGNSNPDAFLAVFNVSIPLPVELMVFKVQRQAEKVLVLWETATEIENDYFSVQKSTNGIDFTGIAKVTGAGNSYSPIKYGVEDSDFTDGIVYYRLVQTDFDGQTTTSKTLSLFIRPKTEGNKTIYTTFGQEVQQMESGLYLQRDENGVVTKISN